MRRTRKFAIHERTRRLICRLAFLLLCLLPTVAVTGWIGIIRLPAYQSARRASWQRELSRQWGLVVSLDAVRHPRRGVTLLDSVRLQDPETGKLIASIRQIEIGDRGDGWVVLAAQPEVQSDQIYRLWEAFHERFLRSDSPSESSILLHAGELTIRRDDQTGSSTLSDVRCRWTRAGDGPRISFEFRDVALPTAEPVQLRVTRNRQLSPPATRWELDTRSTPLPCSLLADQVPVLRWLGDDGTYQGTVDVVCSPSGWHGELAGRFRNVDLERLVTERYEHKLSGTAEVLFRRARFQNGKLSDAAGDVICGGGVVSRSLLAQADRTLGLVADSRVRALEADTLWRYRELRFGFDITANGLRLVGHCQNVGEGVVMADQYGPLLRDRPQEIAQVVALVQTLAAPNGEQVPATAEAYQLLHVLPIPSKDADRAHLATPGLFYSPLRME